MGLVGSRYIQEPYQLDTPSFVDTQTVTTGDIVLFSHTWQRSRISRAKKRAFGDLWSTGGIVINSPNVFPEAMLLEYQTTIPDDYLTDFNTQSQVASGVRLVSLASRLKANNYSAYMIRKTTGQIRELCLNKQKESDFYIALKPLMESQVQFQPSEFLVACLKQIGFIRVSYARLDMTDLAGSKLSKCTNRCYDKGNVYVVSNGER